MSGVSCLDCFSALRCHFSAFIHSVKRTVHWKRSREGVMVDEDRGGAVGGEAMVGGSSGSVGASA